MARACDLCGESDVELERRESVDGESTVVIEYVCENCAEADYDDEGDDQDPELYKD